MKLHLGVLDVAYHDANGGNTGTTTGEVAEKLEEQYHVMHTFYETRKQKIADALAESMADSLEALIKRRSEIKKSKHTHTFQLKQYGESTSRIVQGEVSSLTYAADQKIETLFRKFIFANEMQIVALALTGKPISAAAQRGVSHRKKHPYAKKNKERPAFVDTGLYVASFRAWTSPT